MISRRQFLRGDLFGRTTAPGPLRRAQIRESCVAYRNVVCRSCADACVAAAIRFRPRAGGAALPEVDNEKCTGCGACVAPCPSGAIGLV